MTTTKPIFLTIDMEAEPCATDPMDSPGSSKRLMIDTADRLFAGALAKMPGYLSSLPAEACPSAEDLGRVFRRDYKINGPRLRVEVSVVPSALPVAWVEGLQSIAPDEDPPLAIVWTARLMGWLFGLDKKDREKVVKQAHDSVVDQSQKKVQQELCSAMIQLASASIEAELLHNRNVLLVDSPLRSITLQRKV